MLLLRRVDALIVASVQSSVHKFRDIEAQRVPYVLIDRRFLGLGANFVGSDDERIGALATAHLLERGCSRVAHIRGQDTSTGTGRCEGYRRALFERGLAVLRDYVQRADQTDVTGDASGYQAMVRLLSTPIRNYGDVFLGLRQQWATRSV